MNVYKIYSSIHVVNSLVGVSMIFFLKMTEFTDFAGVFLLFILPTIVNFSIRNKIVKNLALSVVLFFWCACLFHYFWPKNNDSFQTQGKGEYRSVNGS